MARRAFGDQRARCSPSLGELPAALERPDQAARYQLRTRRQHPYTDIRRRQAYTGSRRESARKLLRTLACKGTYSFLKDGEQTVRLAYERAIDLAEHYIYIEDQYLWPCTLVKKLNAALRRGVKVIFVTSHEYDAKALVMVHNDMRHDIFLDEVRAGAEANVFVFHLQRPSDGTDIYVHSKLMIVDDCYAAVGSANISRRSHTSESELHIAVVDATSVPGQMNGTPVTVCDFAKNLRMELWTEHLRVSAATIDDPILGLTSWPTGSGQVHHAVVHQTPPLFLRSPCLAGAAAGGLIGGTTGGILSGGSGVAAGTPVGARLGCSVSFLSAAGFTEITSSETPTTVTQSITLAVRREIVFDLPGLSGFQLVLGRGNGFFELPLEVELDRSGTNGNEVVFDHLTITGMIALRFPRSILKPMVQSAGLWQEVPDEFREVVIDTSVVIDSNREIRFGGAFTFDLEPAMVGETSVIISASDVELVLSDAAIPPGAPAGFRGVYIGTAELAMQDPGFPVTGLSLNNALIGRGGFSGDIDASLNLDGSLFGFDFTLTHFGLTFLQNSITGSDIRGRVTVPFFEGPIDVALALASDGSFSVGLSSTTGLATLTVDGLLEMQLNSIELASKLGVAEIGLGGKLKLDFNADLDLPSFEISKLTINSRGEVTIEGG